MFFPAASLLLCGLPLWQGEDCGFVCPPDLQLCAERCTAKTRSLEKGRLEHRLGKKEKNTEQGGRAAREAGVCIDLFK